jgi:hypothetical protein
VSSLIEQIEKLNLPNVQPLAIPGPVLEVASRLGLVLTLTCSSAPEQYDVLRDGARSGYIRVVRHGVMSVSYPDAGDEDLYGGPVDGYGGFADHEREPRLLFALGLIAARMMNQ